jgi:hypothetical protein
LLGSTPSSWASAVSFAMNFESDIH